MAFSVDVDAPPHVIQLRTNEDSLRMGFPIRYRQAHG